MKRKKRYTLILGLILAVIAVALAVVLFLLFEKQSPLFQRLAVSIVETGQAREKITPDKEGEALLKEKIPAGTFMRFADKGLLTIKPRAKGDRGIFFTFAAKSRDGNKVKTNILLKRNGKTSRLKKYQGETYLHSFSKEMSFLKDDEIQIEMEGSGAVVVNKPVFYDIVEKEKRQYVFVIALDTLRDDRVGAERSGVPLTPAISRFKQDAAVFSNTFSQSSWTLPSFTCFFTGLYEFHHQITRTTALENDKPFLIEPLARKFLTVNFNAGLWMESKFGFARGFDFFSVMSSPTDSYGGKVLFDNTVDFLKNTNVPSLFMFLHTYQIHSPYAPPEEYLNKLAPASAYKKLDSFFYAKQFHRGIDANVKEAMEVLYDAEILAFDDFFDHFVTELKELGIYDQSLIVFFTDHGEEFYEHKGWAHCHSLYNEVIKSPLFFKFPAGRFKGKEIKTNAAVIDILPTILDIYGEEAGAAIDGRSLMPLLKDEKWDRDYLFSSTSVTWLVKNIPPKFAVIHDHFKLIHNFPYSRESLDYFSEFGLPPEEPNMMVFDLEKDPLETAPLNDSQKKSLMKGFMFHVKKIKETIEAGMKRKRRANIRMSEQEKEKLKSLGYL